MINNTNNWQIGLSTENRGVVLNPTLYPKVPSVSAIFLKNELLINNKKTTIFLNSKIFGVNKMKRVWAFKNIEKYCLNCGKLLKLNCNRDIERKKFCSRHCLRSFSARELWKNEEYRLKIFTACNTPEANLKKASHKENHPFWHKKRSKEFCIALSKGISQAYLDGKFDNAITKYIHGFIKHSKILNKNNQIYYRSSYEKNFLENILQDNNLISIKSESIRIQYEETHYYIPDFLCNVNNQLYLIEIKPVSMLNFGKNQLKFEKAILYCNENNIIFKILTENDLFDNWEDKQKFYA